MGQGSGRRVKPRGLPMRSRAQRKVSIEIPRSRFAAWLDYSGTQERLAWGAANKATSVNGASARSYSSSARGTVRPCRRSMARARDCDKPLQLDQRAATMIVSDAYRYSTDDPMLIDDQRLIDVRRCVSFPLRCGCPRRCADLSRSVAQTRSVCPRQSWGCSSATFIMQQNRE
jgi:hypothetical protein